MGKYKPCFSPSLCSRVSGHHSSCGRTGLVFRSPATSHSPRGGTCRSALRPVRPRGGLSGSEPSGGWRECHGGSGGVSVIPDLPRGPSCRPHARGGHPPPAFHLQPPRGTSGRLLILSFQRGRSQTFLPSRVTQGVCRPLTPACEARLSGGGPGGSGSRSSAGTPPVPSPELLASAFLSALLLQQLGPQPCQPRQPQPFPCGSWGRPRGLFGPTAQRGAGAPYGVSIGRCRRRVGPRITRICR